MSSSEVTSIIAAIISIGAFSISIFNYRRDRNKSNQDLVFQEKITAYKNLLFYTNYIFESFFDLIDDIQDHDGSKKDWVKHFKKESNHYDKLVTKFQNEIFKSTPVVPRDVYNELIEFGIESRHFITSSFNGNTKITMQAHENLELSLRKIINLVREDLKVDKLNVTLSKRLK